MIFRRGGFTLLELMIVLAIFGIMIAAIYPQMMFYYARWRDVARVSNIKELSTLIQEYSRTNDTYPSTTNTLTVTSQCFSEIITWSDALPQFKDKQFSQLKANPVSKNKDPWNNIFGPAIYCDQPGSYFYNSLNEYGLIAARMEIQTTWANYNTMADLLLPAKINDMVTAVPLDKDDEDLDKIFLIITN